MREAEMSDPVMKPPILLQLSTKGVRPRTTPTNASIKVKMNLKRSVEKVYLFKIKSTKTQPENRIISQNNQN